eukprot:gnl/MRDRNA2_/MRDRNA2_69922_c0_seq1.p1 gnl/MRDRNA2_/MRDRNA2_69922_c0~~gnl/MRDRNA2_/MRDRNA2_69922_c0_seq1.p1  ORF type:complete len:366 (+),score=49.07 gnl/MRDRNA2_/MRDRNA2_69922_c0_seq1:111-1208(+)
MKLMQVMADAVQFNTDDLATDVACAAYTAIGAGVFSYALIHTRRIWNRDPAVSKAVDVETTALSPAASAAEYDFDKRHRTLRFIVLWTVTLFTVAGFAPAYVLKSQGNPWYFDAVRRIGPNMFEKSTSLHAIGGLFWVAVTLHQTITGYVGGIGKNSPTGKSWYAMSHRAMGYIGALLAFIMSASGCWILFGSTVSRHPDKLAVALDGMFVTLNVVAGIMHVRRGDIAEHKQYMGWAIVWTAWPGFLRAYGYTNTFLRGNPPVSPICQQLQTTNAPHYCEPIAFVISECGIGMWPACLAFGSCALAGCAMAARMDRWRSGAQAGNLVAAIGLTAATFPPIVASALFHMYGSEGWKTCTGFSYLSI